MSRLTCRFGAPDNDWGVGDLTLAEAQARMDADARGRAEEHERFRRAVAKRMLKMLKSEDASRNPMPSRTTLDEFMRACGIGGALLKHPPVPRGVWR